MQEELVLKVDGGKSWPVPEAEEGFQILERQHLQEWILKHPQILGDKVRIVASEFDKWQSASGYALRDRLDILGLDADGRLVLAELKVGTTPHTVHMQAINYAAMVSRLSVRDVAELYAAHHGTSEDVDIEEVIDVLATQCLLDEESIRNPRIVVVASAFPASVTTSVVWLNERGVDFSLIRYRPYRVADDSVIVTFSKLFPVPTVEDFTVGRRTTASGGAPTDPGPPWDEPSLRQLSIQGNEATLALLDLCAAEPDEPVKVVDIASHAGLTPEQVRGQLAGLTMRIRNAKHGFPQNVWPVTVTFDPNGLAMYTFEPALAAQWRAIRQGEMQPGDSDLPALPPSDGGDA
jgi:hypothetical protein